MARPHNKKDLILASTENFQKLIDLIQGLSDVEKNTEFAFDLEKKKEAHWGRDKNLRDVLIHLWEWHKLLIRWINHNDRENNAEKKTIQFLEDGFSWKTCGDMNQLFWNRNQNLSENDALELLKKSHCDVMSLLEDFSEQELFEKDVFSWVGGSVLGSYFISTTSSHYDWAIKKLKAHKKILLGK